MGLNDGILHYMKNTLNVSELDKLSKKFARLTSQMTRTRDLDKMAQIEKDIFRVIDRMDRLTANYLSNV